MALREILAFFGIEVDDKKLDGADKKVDNFTGKIEKLVAVVGGVLVAGEFASFVGEIERYGDELDKASIRAGLNTDALQELGFAAGQSGSSVEGLTFALLQLEDRAGDAFTNKVGANAKAFNKLGISVKDAAGEMKGTDVLFTEVSEKIKNMKSPAEQVTTAINLFGRGGKELVPLLLEGADGLAELRGEFKELGGGYTKAAVKASRDFNDALGRASVLSQTVRGRIATVLLPALQRLVDGLTKAGAYLLELAKNSSIVETVLGSLGVALGALAIKMAIAFAPLLGTLAGIGILVLLVEDLVTLFRGGESIIGRFIDKIYGVGTAAKGVRDLRDAFDGMVTSIKDAIRVMQILKRFTEGDFSLSKEDIGAVNRVNAFTGAADVVDPNANRAAETLAKQRREAAKNGQTFIAPGETLEEATAAKQQAMFFGPAAPSSGATVQQKNEIHIHGVNDPEAVGEAVDRHIQRRNREAADSLHKVAEPE
jgi:hypothetical protein